MDKWKNMGETELRQHKFTWIALLAAAILLLSGCGGGEAPKGTGASHEATAASGETAGASESASSKASTTPSPSPSPSPSPTPSPTPTRTPKGITKDGWVTGIPDFVPKFTYGTIDIPNSKIVEGPVSSVFNLCFRGVTRENIDAYAKLLEAEGYTFASAEIGNTYLLTASLEKKRELATLVITLSLSEGIAIFTLGAPV